MSIADYIGHKNPTQAARLEEYLKTYGSITALEAIRDLGILNLKGRVCELRQKKKLDIVTRWEIVPNRWGGKPRIARYVLVTKEDF